MILASWKLINKNNSALSSWKNYIGGFFADGFMAVRFNRFVAIESSF